MLFIIVCICILLILLPFVYSLPGFVYNRQLSKLKIFRKISPRMFWILFLAALAFYFAFYITLLKSVAPFTEVNIRLLVGCSVAFICIVFFFRLIPIYYAEDSEVQSRQRYKKSFCIELFFILLFTAALEVAAFDFYAYAISASVGVFLTGLRVRKLIQLYKKYKAAEDESK